MERKKWEIVREMERLNIRSIFDITEFDQSLNDATRRDITKLLKKHRGKLIGLKLWSYEVKRGEELENVPNFGVDYIFRAEDEEKVKRIVENFEKRQGELRKIGLAYSMNEVGELLDKLDAIAVYECLWV